MPRDSKHAEVRRRSKKASEQREKCEIKIFSMIKQLPPPHLG